jgi:hypothetical protein
MTHLSYTLQDFKACIQIFWQGDKLCSSEWIQITSLLKKEEEA